MNLRICLLFLLGYLTAGCSEVDTNEPLEPSATFASNVYQFCMDQNSRWLMNHVAAVQSAVDNEVDTLSVRYEEMHVFNFAMDGQSDPSRKELLVRFTATQNGEELNLFSLSEIDPTDCALSQGEVNFGLDRYEDRGNRRVLLD